MSLLESGEYRYIKAIILINLFFEPFSFQWASAHGRKNTKDDYRSELAASTASSLEKIIITWMKNKLHWNRQGRYKKMDKDRLQTGGLWHGTKC